MSVFLEIAPCESYCVWLDLLCTWDGYRLEFWRRVQNFWVPVDSPLR